jgi:hypothetical protein
MDGKHIFVKGYWWWFNPICTAGMGVNSWGESPLCVNPVNVVRRGHPVEGGKEVGVYRIFVEDNGIGFDEKYLDKVFTAFQRLHGRRQYEEVGMGLTICKKSSNATGVRSRPKSSWAKGPHSW